ncbi:DUF4012 domain-containing protein [Microbacterium sp. SS28]|uniref:DUF4012 domain-containing protein n=1 Tax=Microbacterium sp. SS28 TaxID=2919948 RepID=UPI001FA960EF|nr:DUF4012 domain-containing protein [Microbacterium sp. SS28]
MTPSANPRPLRVAGVVFASILGALLIAAVAATAWIGVRGFLAYGHLRAAQTAAATARDSIADPTAAAGAIDAVSSETSAARALTSDPVWSLSEHLPWVGPQLAATATVAASLDDVAGSALAPLAQVASTFDLAALRPQDGRIDLSTFTSLQDAATAGSDGIAAAAASVSAVDRTALVTPLRSAVNEVSTLLDEAEGAASAVSRATVLLPAMLGAEGPRDYLVLFQNNAEWRSLGGIPGAMALLHTDGGALTLTAQESTGDYPRYDESVLPLDDEVTAIYGERPGRWMQNVTQVPDFAVSASLAREMWAREHGGKQVDGVIALDPVALTYLLGATGPVTLPTGDVLTPESTVPLLLNEVYARYSSPADQDAFFALAAASVFEALSRGDADPVALVSALTRAGDERRLNLWSAHEADQAVLEETTLAGGLPETDADAARFGVFLNDGTGSKMDFYLTSDSRVAWDQCTTDAAGRASGTAKLTVTIASNAPADAANLPPYITGEGIYGVPPGIARTVVYVYLPEGFDLAGAELSDDGGFGGGMHAGRRVVSFTTDLAPGGSTTAVITAATATPSAPVLEAVSTPTLVPQPAATAVCGG